MKNDSLKRFLGVLLALAAVGCFLAGVTVEDGSGSALGFAGVVKVLLCAVAALLLLLASHLFVVKSEKGKKLKRAVFIALVTAIILGAAIDNRMEMMAAEELLP